MKEPLSVPVTSFSQGFEERIHYSARTFRYLLDSLARPGKVNQLEYPSFFGQPPCYSTEATPDGIALNLYALGALATLLDGETSFAMVADGRELAQTEQAVQWLLLRSGSKLATLDTANFVFFCNGGSGGLLSQASLGTLVEPESSATVFYCVEFLHENTDIILLASGPESGKLRHVELTGPGIQGQRVVSIVGLAEGEIEFIQATLRNYPLGIDIYLIDRHGRCIGLPRTTRMRIQNNILPFGEGR